MEYILLLLVFIILITIFNFKSDTARRLGNLEYELQELKKIKKQQQTEQPAPILQPVEEIITQPTQAPITQTEEWQSGFKIVEEIVEQSIEEKPTIQEETIISVPEEEPVDGVGKIAEQFIKKQTPTYIPPPHKPSFFERNPDLEKFIGENLISKIGIGILVLAIAFFVKYAIDNNWIGAVGRVGVGILCGGILVALAHRLRNSYKAFSSVLVGGGLAVFYFTITLAHQKFQLFGDTPTIAFIIMIVITAFAVVLSLLYDRQELAIISLIGGFASPFMVSDGSGHYQTLFIYLIILNAGLLVMAYHKAWRLLNLLAFIFTILIFGGWLAFSANEQTATYRNAFIYATVFYLLFFAINIAHNIKENKKFIASDFGILLANTSLYFATGLYCIVEMQAAEYKGLFSIAMGIFNLAASYFLFRNRKVDANILYLLIGLTLTFISLTAPLQLHGNYITLFWASEAVLLYWLYQKSKIAIFQFSSLIIWCAMLISLFMDWVKVYGLSSDIVTIIANKGFITTAYAAISTYIIYLLINKQNAEGLKTLLPKVVYHKASLILLFIAGAIEIMYQFSHYYPSIQLNILYLLLYTLAFAWLFIFFTKKIGLQNIDDNIELILLTLCVGFYFITIPITYNIQETILLNHQYGIHFVAHWLVAILVVAILYRIIQLLVNKKENLNASGTFTWIICAVLVIFLSVEIHLLVNNMFYSANNSLETLQRVYIKTGLPILWGVCSFGFIWLGMKHKYKPLRIIALTLFSITLVKLFLFDISNIPIAGKIAAFFILGVILLIVSFMYQRLKKIITDDEEKTDA